MIVPRGEGDPYETVRRLRASQPTTPAELKRLAIAYSQAQQWLLFRQTIERVLELDPKDASARFALGSYWMNRADDGVRAEAEFRAVIAQDPGHSLARYHVGILHEKRNEWPEADTEYRKMGDSSALGWLGRARVSRAVGNEPEALERALKAESLDPGNLEAVRFLARQLQSQAPREAAARWRRLTEAEPNEANHWYGLYRALAALGDPGAEAARVRFDEVRQAYGTR